MELTIDNRIVKITTGTRFLRELDREYKAEMQGAEVDFGLYQLYANFAMESVSALNLAIYAGSRTNKNFKPTPNQIDEYLDEQEDIDWLFDAFKEELRESNRTKKLWKQMEGNLPAVEEAE